MGFVGDLFRNDSGVQLYNIIGLFIFITLFFVMVYRVIKMPKSELKHIKESILENDNTADSN
ncbi:MAG: hypothetical protein WCL51_14315 [Bacteroidota bacterium]